MGNCRWLFRLAFMSLFVTVVSSCTELTPTGSSSEYVIQTPGSPCLPGDVDGENLCTADVGCSRVYQWCNPATGEWTDCRVHDICRPDPGAGPDGGMCTEGATRNCEIPDNMLGEFVCSGGLWGTCNALPLYTYDAGVPTTAPCGGDPLIGTSCSAGLGECAATGTYICNATGMRVCDAVAGTPVTETCDNLDNDCDGAVDNSVVRSCYSGPAGTASVGDCRYGTQTCTAGTWATTCSGEVLPLPDFPDDGFDQDCNGADMSRVECGMDPRVGRPCSVGLGVCVASGTYVCDVATNVVSCSASAGAAQTEVCDNLDNDCDGTIDDGIQRTCYSGPAGTDGVGICHHGNQVCTAGVFGACIGEQTPLPELPDNGIDEDCSGSDLELVDCGGDMSVGMGCFTGIGACRASGSLECVGGFLRCNAVALPPTSETCNNIDDDCDSFVDDSVVRSCYSGPAGTAGVGACMPGSQICVAGVFGACSGETLPTAETCPPDGTDQDCSGGDLLCGACGGDPTLGDPCTVGLGICAATGTVGCSGSSLTCSATAGTAGVETCNGLDDDCNGVNDNGTNVACYTGPAGTAGVGACRAGLRICSGGVLGACSGQVLPGLEVCGNAIDEDCNGIAAACPPPPPVDAGTMMSDAGSMSSDAGTSDGGMSTPESVARAGCLAMRTGSSTMAISYNHACLNALFGTCPSGWVTVLYDENGCENPSDPGAATLTTTSVRRTGGEFVASLRCGTTYMTWPVSSRNDIVNTACVSSIMFDSDQLADAESRFCPDLAAGTALLPRIPGHSSVTVSCP